MNDTDIKISVVTATYNADIYLPRLIESLCNQTDKDFQWSIADGNSSDSTLKLLEGINDLNIIITSQTDFGIYDALNRAIKLSDCEYYIVVGADDILYNNAIADYRAAILKSHAEIITGKIISAGKNISVKSKPSWIYGQASLITSHSVGAAFKKSLHEKYGYYSNKFPIAADQLFVKQACLGGASVFEADFTAGEFGHSGLSNDDITGTLCEIFRIQLLTEKNKYTQVLIFILRLLKNIHRL